MDYTCPKICYTFLESALALDKITVHLCRTSAARCAKKVLNGVLGIKEWLAKDVVFSLQDRLIETSLATTVESLNNNVTIT
jgi:hypothetical protein